MCHFYSVVYIKSNPGEDDQITFESHKHDTKYPTLNDLLDKTTPASHVVFDVDFFILRQTQFESVEYLL